MPRNLQKLISAGIFAGLLAIAVRIIDEKQRSTRDKGMFALISGGFTLIGALACLGGGFVISQIIQFGDATIGLIVAVAALLIACVAFAGIGISLMITYKNGQRGLQVCSKKQDGIPRR
ncbi:hypothetical protein [Lacticaseibacillus yichunensis]|uniref:DUF4064 domain-containing protein n=1 Tax=Lacticaseibacillus yichunensis TaxID=2486015 RepID=A0ABW4CQ48_9LACO|nr:hypothetical protein [Lacticaseibacillus yichunensis]